MTDEPVAVTKRRKWRAVIDFYVDDTPDPAYDVRNCEALADELARQVKVAATILPGNVHDIDVLVLE
jgi:hypothetical protein